MIFNFTAKAKGYFFFQEPELPPLDPLISALNISHKKNESDDFIGYNFLLNI
jgi:hypothetical protein